MAEEWFVRVQEREYGPVDLETLREWKAEGRLLADNPVRQENESAWSTAATIPGLFETAVATETPSEQLFRRRSFGQILSETLRIYHRGFPQFFALALLVALPSLAFKIAFAFVNYREGEPASHATRIASPIAVVTFVLALVAWPIFVAGLQFATHELALGRTIRLGEILRRATNFWPRVARLSVLVYGSYIFWTILPLLVIFAFASAPSLLSFALAFVAAIFQVYMASRLFINFLFWQQTSTIGGLDGADALVASRALARSRSEAPRLQRPLYRGAIIASVWLLLLLALSVATELPFMIVRLSGITSLEDAYAMIQNMINAPAPDAMTIASYVVSSLVQTILRPLLGIAVVVLYFDAETTR